MKYVIPGGSGQVGQVLARAIVADGHDVVLLSRSPAKPGLTGHSIQWDGKTLDDWVDEIDGADVLINLAGRSVNCRYHKRNREQMIRSRVDSTAILGQAVGLVASPPTVWLQASTATIYRHALDRPMDEIDGELGGDEPGAPETWNFSIEVAKSWERAFFAAQTPKTRKVAMRSAMTMSPDRGGVFDYMLWMVRLGLGGTNGSGKQFVSWVHDRDFIRAVKFMIERDDLEGCINICSPNPIPNRDFMRAIRKAWGMPIGLPAAAWMMEIGAFFLRTETELVLKSRRVIPTLLTQAGFKFDYPHWPEAAEDLCWRVREGEGR